MRAGEREMKRAGSCAESTLLKNPMKQNYKHVRDTKKRLRKRTKKSTIMKLAFEEYQMNVRCVSFVRGCCKIYYIHQFIHYTRTCR